MKHQWLEALASRRKFNFPLSSERQKFYYHLEAKTFYEAQNLLKPRIFQTKRL